MGRNLVCVHRKASWLLLAASIGLCAGGSGAAQSLDTPPSPPATDGPKSNARGPIPKGIRVWAHQIQQNHPSGVLATGQQASVRVRATVDPKGQVADCEIVQSSGFAVLDQSACDSMRRFATFIPAVDASGAPTTGTWAIWITYKSSIAPPIKLAETPGITI